MQATRADISGALVSLGVTLLVMALILFLPAGTLDWPAAWWYLGVFTVAILAAVAYIARADPELFAIRRKPQAGTKTWDLFYAGVSVVAIAATLPAAGLDRRFGWSVLPVWEIALGYLLFAGGFWLTSWAQGVNRHFELTVRIQTDRNHKVIDTGPYAIIRHPGYVGGMALALGTAFALGSGVALIPVAVALVGLVLRTIREDATLQAELDGYADYARRVRFKWIPGVW